MDEPSPARIVLGVGSFLVALKALLIPAYASTDFEVHRNWMAVTWNKPLSEWYTESTSEWTLDYPPLFAFFEYGLAWIANFIGLDDVLRISKEPIFNQRILYFQRFSVIFVDVFYIFVCGLFAFKSNNLVNELPQKLRYRARCCCFILLACNQGLLLVDSVHFQYNGLLTAIFLLSVYFIDQGQLVLGAFFYAILLNFKHIYVYYAFGYVTFYLWHYFNLTELSFNEVRKLIWKGLILGSTLLIPFAVSFGPFVAVDGIEGVENILKRLFPISRGLTHAFWAPNFWSLYNFADLILYRVLKLLKIGNFEPPTYTSGLVQEYSHSVLLSVSTLATLFLVVSVSLLVFALSRCPKSFAQTATVSALIFFFFGYHVHEKAIILVTVPMTILSIKHAEFLPIHLLLSTIASFSIFPLLFTTFEIYVKYTICASYFFLVIVTAQRFAYAKMANILPLRYVIYIGLLVTLEFYNTFLHQFVFGAKFEFAPLLAISLTTSLGVVAVASATVLATSRDTIRTLAAKARCIADEHKIRANLFSVQTVDDESEVRIVAGVDVSASKDSSDFVVVAMSVYKYPEMEHISTIYDTAHLVHPYIPDYLAIRECDVVVDFVRKVVTEYPELRPDVILCDGNGQFHPRACGFACHIGAKTGIATIGVAKYLLASVVANVYGHQDTPKKVEEFEKKLEELDKKHPNGRVYAPFDVVLPVRMNVARLYKSNTKVYISAGYGIELGLATKIAMATAINASTTCEPIRQADLKSRELVRELYGR